ncbi:MAG TPA: EVE domain-containing protein [Thermoplasmata archaeon]|nr:EVE domain-containing protein [Thermoplasmata archaeon]
MHRWLLKQEPTGYSWRDLVREGTTSWNGVHNPLALQNLRRMAPRDVALFYHTGTERAAVGIVTVTSTPRPDPDDPRGSWTVDVRASRPLVRPVTLAELKVDPALDGFALLRLPRLSVVPVTGTEWMHILVHERTEPAAGRPEARSRRSRG